ncbi:MAG: asparagine synthase (glutamine-hydrolyzing) [Planctomycetota bacterium]
MSGIAGIVDLRGRRPVSATRLEHMAQAMGHRGLDGQSVWKQPGIGFACRQLQLGNRPEELHVRGSGEDQAVVALDGTLYNAENIRAKLESGSHRLQTRFDDELVLALWATEGEGFFDSIQGQFAVAIWDGRQRRLLLARDRFGIRPLHWVESDGWLLFASEIKGLLASGLVEARADVRGISQVFTFFGLPGPRTCFQGVSAIIPGRYIDVRLGRSEETATLDHRVYWQMDFSQGGHEAAGANEQALTDRYEQLLLDGVRRRLAAETPVAAYSSGGLDSSLLLSMARHVEGRTPPTLTFHIDDPKRDESAGAELLSEYLGHETNVVKLTGSDLIGAFAPLVYSCESPVVDVSAAALFRLAEAAHGAGYKAVISGEGADEWQAGYPWFRIFKRVRWAACVPGARLDRLGYWLYARHNGSRQLPYSAVVRAEEACGGPNAWLLAYNLMTTTQYRFFSRAMRDSLAGYSPYEDLGLPLDHLCGWDSLTRSLYLGSRVHLAGLHCHARGDRATMHASVEGRYPFLDERVVKFLASLPPRYKMRGMNDKYLQRKLCERWLPERLTGGRKRLLHSPLEAFHQATPPRFVEQLLSEESLRTTGYFDPHGVRRWRERLPHMRHGFARLFIAMGLVGVISTQLWHHWYLANLVDLPNLPSPAGPFAPSRQ